MDTYRVKDSVRCTLFDGLDHDDSYILFDGKRHWQVSYILYFVVNELSAEKNLEELQAAACNDPALQERIPEETMQQVLEFLENNGLLEGSKPAKQSPPVQTMWLKIRLMSGETLKKLKILTFFYNRYLFPICSVAGVVWLVYILLHYEIRELARSLLKLPAEQLIVVWICLGVITAFHEFGHISALIRGGGTPGGMGFGLYYIMPVAWSDVTEAWSLPRRERLTVDYGGIYFQLIAASLIYILNELTLNSESVRIAAIVSTTTLATNLSPVLKFDGYWIACDGFGITDPMREAQRLLRPADGDQSGMRQNQKVIFVIFLLISSLVLAYFYLLMLRMSLAAVQMLFSDIRYFAVNSAQIMTALSWKQVVWFLRERTANIIVIMFLLRLVLGTAKKLIVKKAGDGDHHIS